MKAWVLHDIGEISYEEAEKPELNETEVLLSVKAAGICGSDIPRIYKTGAHRMPLIPGHEFSGQVVEVGSKADKTWLNERVGVYPLIPCHTCLACRKGKYEMCRQYRYLGSRQDGSFAEYVAVPEANLIRLPDNVSFEQAAMLEPMAVAVHAMRRVVITEEDTVVVCGLGTIGMLLILFLRERGIKNILAVGNKDFQKDKLTALGIAAPDFCDIRHENMKEYVDLYTEGAGADVFFECVGSNETVSQAINLTAPGGKICMVGNPCSDMKLDQQTYWKLLRNQLEVTGTWNSSFFGRWDEKERQGTDWYYALRLLEQSRIKPEQFISHRLPLMQLEAGLHLMRDKSDDYLKVMISKSAPAIEIYFC